MLRLVCYIVLLPIPITRRVLGCHYQTQELVTTATMRKTLGSSLEPPNISLAKKSTLLTMMTLIYQKMDFLFQTMEE